MDNFELFEKVTGRVSLRTGKILEAALKDACRKTGAQYHEAVDQILITGTWDQILETRRVVNSQVVDERNSSSSSDHSIELKRRRHSFDTDPVIAKYIRYYVDNDMKNIEQKYQVKITWSKDNTKVGIKAQSGVSDFDSACDQFAAMYQHYHKTVSKISFNCCQDGPGYSKKHLEMAVVSAPRHVDHLILDTSSDGSIYTLCGTNASLSQAKKWIRKQLGVTFDRSTSPKGPPKDALSHETDNKLKVEVYQGDITKENADIIVNACNTHLDHGGGVSHAISKAGGPTVQQESDDYVMKNGALKTGDVAVTGAGFLSCKRIVHAVGPQWNKHGKEGSLKLFRKLFMNVYHAAVKLGLKSIAMPAISSGIYGVPKEVCAQAAFSFVDEIDQMLASDPSSRPFEIRLVNIDSEIVKIFSQEFTKWRLKGRKVERRHSFSVIKKEDKGKPVEKNAVDDMHKTPKMKALLLTPIPRRSLSTPQDGSSMNGMTAVKHGSLWTSKFDRNSSGTSGTSKNDRVSSDTSGTSENDLVSSGTSGTSKNDRVSSDAPVSAVQVNGVPCTSSSHQGAVLFNAHSSMGRLGTSSLTTSVRYDQNGFGSHSPGGDSKDCPICRCSCTDALSLPKCGHTFCKSCIERAFLYQKKCPMCQEVYGTIEGDQPEGTMDVRYRSHSLPGYEGHGCYIINYVIPTGYQDSRHPKPGQMFTGTSRQAFLPATKEGKVVLELLQKAFEKKLVFTVGRSSTTGRDDCVTWNDIHHKTSMTGGPQNFGYPDPDYLNRVKAELKAKGIVPEK